MGKRRQKVVTLAFSFGNNQSVSNSEFKLTQIIYIVRLDDSEHISDTPLAISVGQSGGQLGGQQKTVTVEVGGKKKATGGRSKSKGVSSASLDLSREFARYERTPNRFQSIFHALICFEGPSIDGN